MKTILLALLYLFVVLAFYSFADAHGRHTVPWNDSSRVLHHIKMGLHDPALQGVHAFYVDVDQDGKTDRVILRSVESDHAEHVIYDDSYEKFLVEYGRYWAVDDE
jgi:hypothetical protein